MKKQPNFTKSIICTVVAAMCAPSVALADPLDFSHLPPGLVAIPPTPNVILTVDDSGSMAERIDGASSPVKMAELRRALKEVFEDKLLLPDGKIRLAWQAMWKASANSIVVGGINSMKVLDETHRANFLDFAAGLKGVSSTPSHRMMLQAYNYMKTGKSINSPWAFKPGAQETPYLGCRRAYHIFMTDGAWNGRSAGEYPGEVDNVSAPLPTPDSTISYDVTSVQTQVYRDAQKDSLADWAMKMWREDLQPEIDNDIKPSTTDGVADIETVGDVKIEKYWNPKHNPAKWQHVVQYTIGYGKGAYEWTGRPTWSKIDDDNYGASGDYANLIKGATNWPTGLSDDNSKNPAELWHMALNSRGKFYPTGPGRKYDLKDAFRKIVETINLENASDVGSMSASSSTNIRTNVNRFVAGFDPKRWSGYVYADRLDTAGNVGPEPTWDVNTGLPAPKDRKTTAQKLDALATVDDRLILTTNDATNTGVTFEWDAGSAKLSAAQKLALNIDGKGQDRVNFLRGDRSKEGGTTTNPFRVRDSRQGDIVNSSVWYTGTPASNYPHKGYKAFTSANADRLPMIYVGGNDGMLHGFSAVNGDEKIAYVPKGLIPELYKLSDPSYAHRYYVDGSPFTGDVDVADKSSAGYAPDWRTMLVGTLAAGGKGYFVLDVSKPGFKDGTAVSSFSKANAANLVVIDRTLHASAAVAAGSDDEDIGHIFASPVMDDSNPFRTSQVALMNDDRWAVVMGNGYNSNKERPVLLIQYLDGNRALKKIVATGSQVPSSPVNAVADTNVLANGLSAPKLLDLNSDGKVDIAYAGDLKGNLWKFDLTSKTASEWKVATFSGSARPLFVATDSAGKRQPISAPPIAKANDRGAGGMMVAFGTGVNVTDANRISKDVQTAYSIHDNTKYKRLTAGNLEVNMVEADNGAVPVAVTGRSTLVKQSVVTGADGIEGENNNKDQKFWEMSDKPINYDKTKGEVNQGWYFDFDVPSERVLRSMSFFDGSNNMMVWSLTPAFGGDGTGKESCAIAGTAERAYLTLLNIMDGKRPSVQVMDTNGDGFYSKDGDKRASRMTIAPGPSSMTIGKKTISIRGELGKKKELARMPEQPMRPSWRQLK